VDATDPYGFPYPECDPPLTEDSSDIAQMRALAEAIDTEVGSLVAFSGDEFVSPDACRVLSSAVAAQPSETYATFTSVTFDNSPGAVMGTLPNGITIRQAGFYFITGYVNTSASNDLTRAVINVSGLGDIMNEGIAVGAGATAYMPVSAIVGLNPGQIVRLRMQINTATTTFNPSALSLFRITGAM
jgi:hypothetical protein